MSGKEGGAGFKAPALYALLLLAAGIAAYDYGGLMFHRTIPLATSLILFTIAVVLQLSPYRASALLHLGSAGLFLFSAGWTMSAWHDIRQQEDWVGHYAETTYTSFLVRALADPVEKPASYYQPVLLLAGKDASGWHPVSGKVKLYVYKRMAAALQGKGACYLLPNQLQPLQRVSNPFAPDISSRMHRMGYAHQLFLSAAALKLIREAPEPGRLSRWRQQIRQILHHYIPDAVSVGLVQAILLNTGLEEAASIQDMYRHTGITHIIAISGMHVSLLFYILVLPLFLIRDPRRLWLKYLLVLPFVWLYIALCQYPPSAVRAALSFSWLCMAYGFRRRLSPLQLWSLTGIVMLCAEPTWLYHVGVQLSFLAVLSIILFYQPLRHIYRPAWLPLRWLWDTLMLSLSVQILVAPLIIYYFHQFPVWFLPANVLAALFSTILMIVACLLLLFAYVLPWGAGILGQVLISGTSWFHRCIAFLDQYTPDAAQWLPLDAWDYLLLMCSITLGVLFFRYRKPWALFSGLMVLLVFVLNMMLQDRLAVQQERLVVYAAGRNTLIDYIRGRKAYTYCTTQPAPAEEQYILRPAQLGFRILQRDYRVLGAHELYWHRQRLVWADARTLDRLRPGMDILILSGIADPGLLRMLHPKLLVLAGGGSRRAQAAFYQQLKAEGIPLYDVAVQGAFIFEK